MPDLATTLRERFAAPAPMTIGIEEEAVLLDGDTLDLVARGPEVVEAADPAAGVRLEMPATQVEFGSAPSATVAEAVASLAAGRRALAQAAQALGLRVACLAVHPFAAGEAPLNDLPRYVAIEAAYGFAARRQLLSAVHVHVCVRGRDRPLAVHDALRSHLPDLAALAACAPYYEGRDTGLASVRPLLAALLPRQGIPPVLGSWEALAAGVRGAGDPASWWWELRPHRLHGTIELRVPDAQASLEDTAAIAAVAHALVVQLAARHDADDLPLPEETWLIEQRRWAALRHGPEGQEERLAALLGDLAPQARALGCVAELERARRLLEGGGQAARLREAAGGDPRAAARLAAERFLT